MTTVTYRSGVMAGDTKETDDDDGFVYPHVGRKVFRFPDGRLFGYAGNSDECEILRIATLKHKSVPVLEKCAGLLVQLDGRVSRYEGKLWVPEKAPYHAIGSGKGVAYGAMMAGADARRAVRIAIKIDLNSGGYVRWVSLRGRR